MLICTLNANDLNRQKGKDCYEKSNLNSLKIVSKINSIYIYYAYTKQKKAEVVTLISK